MRLKSFPAAHREHRKGRSGLSLLEVVVSLAIFLFSLTAVVQLMSLSSANVQEASARSRAVYLCQSKIAQIIAGEQPVSGGGGYRTFDDDSTGDGPSNPGFEYSIESQPVDDIPGLYNVQVTVCKDVPGRGKVEISLSQMIMDPGKKGSTLDMPIPGMSATSQ